MILYIQKFLNMMNYPLRLPVIYFSGDATSTKNHGTIIGAMEAGKQVAAHVFDALSG